MKGSYRSHDFARCIQQSSNYYVLATRENLPTLPYSVEEIYELRNTTSRYPGVRKVYSQAKRMYTQISGSATACSGCRFIVTSNTSGNTRHRKERAAGNPRGISNLHLDAPVGKDELMVPPHTGTKTSERHEASSTIASVS